MSKINDYELTWPCHKTLPWSNLFTATAILTSGCNATDVLQLFRNMNLQMCSARTYNRLQAFYVAPSACRTWDFEQASLLEDIREGPCRDVNVGGDARCDSPGYSAKYGTYTIMDLDRNKILDFQLVQVNNIIIDIPL
jgi:solute carrier family 8 (sodium/calcium exchanger)